MAEGYPVPTVEEYTWKKHGVPRQMGERFSRFAGGSLRIDKTQFEDQGLYECTVKNSRGSTTLHMYLTVLGEYEKRLYFLTFYTCLTMNQRMTIFIY